jgi:putative ABC transport system substrate-binding protein
MGEERAMKHKTFALALCALVFALYTTTNAQQPKKIPLIGYLSSTDAQSDSARSEGVRQALRELGYIEGQNITIEYRYAERNRDQGPKLAAELVGLNPAMILVAGGTIWVQAVKDATKTIPIVMIGSGLDPVQAGLVQSLARPGGNLTGLTTQFARDLGGKRLELLKEVAPKIGRIAVLYDPMAPGIGREVKEVLPVAARALRLSIQPWGVREQSDFEKTFAALSRQLPDALHVTGGPDIRANLNRIASFALKHRLPSIYQTRNGVDAGGLIYYGADQADSHRRVAIYVDKILKGAKPAELPVQQPSKFELALNLKTAKQIGVIIPPNVLARADRVIR